MVEIDSAPARSRTAGPVKHVPYWWETETVEPGPPLEGVVRCDVCIVGAGFTGLWTAHQLKLADPSLDVQIVEAEHAGAGASGHADGFITPTIGHSLGSLVHQFGAERARVAYSVVGRSIVEIGRFCKKYGVDAELEPNGYYQVAAHPNQMRWLERDIELVNRLGARTAPELLSAQQAREHIDSPAIHGAFKVGGALVNPRRLTRGICRVVREQGVPVHEGTPALSIERTSAGHVVTTPRGRIVADKLVVATNAYQRQFDRFRDKVKPTWSYAVVTEPLTDEQLAQVRWPGREGFVEARNVILFGRLTRHNRLLIGGGPVSYHYAGRADEDRHVRNLGVTTVLRETLARYFPAWADLRITHAYGGCIAMTRDMVPHVGTNGDGIYYGYGYCGNGTAVTHTVGKVLRDLILGRDSAYTNLLFVRGKEKSYPSEPVAYLGTRVQSALMTLQDRYPSLIKGQLV
jgi:glycine/D-amino acid oxidase-like deaminating enzyme